MVDCWSGTTLSAQFSQYLGLYSMSNGPFQYKFIIKAKITFLGEASLPFSFLPPFLLGVNGWMDDLQFYVQFNSVSIIG